MSRARNVVWTEGLFLTPHIFQQADRYREDLLHFRIQGLIPFAWGVSESEVDRDGLPNGFFTLHRCRGVMPDGLTVQIPDEDPAPEVRSLKELFPPSAQTLDVYLAIPAAGSGSVNFRTTNGSGDYSTRYQMDLLRVADETTEGNECEIPTAKKNFQILFSGESLEGKIWMKIAELGRSAAGVITLNDAAYVPPTIALSGSGSLMAILHRILEMLAAKSSALSNQRRHITEFGSSDIANFWLLHTVNSCVPILSHFYLSLQSPSGATLYGSEPACGGTEHVRSASRSHVTCLGTITRIFLRPLMNSRERSAFCWIPSYRRNTSSFPLEKTPQLWYLGHILDDRLLQSSQFFLAANAQVAANRLIEDVPVKAKISSPDEIGALIGRAVSGVQISHEPIPPSGIPVKPGFKYYHLHASGRWWETICKARGVALYLPDEFPELKVELIAVKE